MSDLIDITVDDLRALGFNLIDNNFYHKIHSKIMKDFSNDRLYRGPLIDLNLNRDKEPIKKMYKKKIGYNLKGEVVKIMKRRGETVLVVANAGGGKTYIMLKVSAELVELDKDKKTVYIIAVPNTSQSNQNEVNEDLVEFGFESIVGKASKLQVDGSDKTVEERLKEGGRKFSCVYDKVDEVITKAKEQGLETVLIVDEAHKLIWDTYRVEALDGMEASTKRADMVIMMTATPDVCKKYYRYDDIYEFIDKKVKNNIKKFKVVFTNNWNLTLKSQVRRLKKLKRIPLIKINNKKTIERLKKSFEDMGYIVEVLTKDSKTGETFKGIEKDGLIGDDVDIIMCTSVIECGISLKDKNIVPVEVIPSCNDFNADNTIQFFARPRKTVDEGILIVKNYQEDIAEKMKELKDLRKNAKPNEIVKAKTRRVPDIDNYLMNTNRDATAYYQCLNVTLNHRINEDGVIYAIEHMLEELDRIDRTKSIEFDTESLNLYINSKKIIQNAFKKRDKFIITSSPMTLETFFEGKIFYDSIEMILDLDGKADEQDIEALNNEKEIIKEKNEEKKARNCEYRQWLEGKNMNKVIKPLMDGKLDRHNIKKYDVDISLRQLIELRDSSLFKTMEKCFRKFSVEETIKIVTSKYDKNGEYISIEDINRVRNKKHMIEQVKMGYFKGLDAKDDIILEIIQDLKTDNKTGKVKQITITDDLIVILNSELTRNNCKGYRNKEVKEIFRSVPDYDFSWKVFYSDKENIKKLEKAISSKNGSLKSSTKSKVIKDIENIYKLGTRVQDNKEYLVINNPHKVFSLDKTLNEIKSSK